MATESPSKDDDFVTGDVRSQIHATLLSMHVLWLREHNRIAERLAEALKYKIDKMSPKEQDEILFQVRFVSFQKTVARVSPPNYSEPLWCGNSLESLHSQSQYNWEVFVSWQNPCTGFTGFTDWTGARVSWSNVGWHGFVMTKRSWVQFLPKVLFNHACHSDVFGALIKNLKNRSDGGDKGSD